jgi:hypothetical protein
VKHFLNRHKPHNNIVQPNKLLRVHKSRATWRSFARLKSV